VHAFCCKNNLVHIRRFLVLQSFARPENRSGSVGGLVNNKEASDRLGLWRHSYGVTRVLSLGFSTSLGFCVTRVLNVTRVLCAWREGRTWPNRCPSLPDYFVEHPWPSLSPEIVAGQAVEQDANKCRKCPAQVLARSHEWVESNIWLKSQRALKFEWLNEDVQLFIPPRPMWWERSTLSLLERYNRA
jgi:hypothetical protein